MAFLRQEQGAAPQPFSPREFTYKQLTEHTELKSQKTVS